ncbi:cytochrome P450 [Boletus reticuloceps]|uniref:Cytochrome P450 n=1 Tax=Boletus reticuloceps TaxID=495285 RepID=A0A8I2YJB8_9AGAM|nr:cytochrome P450 [Boletus reticuloceps]
MPSLLALGILAFCLWRLVRQFAAHKSPLALIPGPNKDHWLTGNYHRLFKDALQYNLALVEKYGGAVKINALLGSQQLYISDPLALHHIVVKDQHIYTETDMFIMYVPASTCQIYLITREQHRKQRKMLNPVFSLANMRDLLPIIQPIADELCTILRSQLPSDGSVEEINVLPWLSRGALEYVCQAALGHSFDALDIHKENEYLEAIRNLAPSVLRLLMVRPLIPFVVRNFSLYWRNRIMDWAPLEALRGLRRVVQVMDATSKRVFAEKKVIMEGRAEPEGPGNLRSRMKGKDIMSIMCELYIISHAYGNDVIVVKANMSSCDADRLTDEELLGQMNTIIFAGFETTTTAIGRILWILASRPDVQARLRSEVRNAKHGYAASHGNTGPWEDVGLPYDLLMGLPYLDAVVRETLRMYPPTSLLSRTVREDAVLPLYRPIKSVSGQTLSEVAIPKGTTLIMSLLAANHNKDMWGEDALEWRPERWLSATGERVQLSRDSEIEETTDKTPGVRDGMKYPGVYASMMTFLGGGRACIGFKFAEMEMKQVVTTLISRIHFALSTIPDEKGNVKEIYWKINGLQVPVVRPPAGDDVTAQVPLSLRLVQPGDFI